MLLSTSAYFFKINFSKFLSGAGTIRVLNSMDSDHDRHCIGTDLGQNLSADNKVAASKERVLSVHRFSHL